MAKRKQARPLRRGDVIGKRVGGEPQSEAEH
jgi:hypothetical protein